jgi:hypothetical protein
MGARHPPGEDDMAGRAWLFVLANGDPQVTASTIE